jgi:hypothetical protein
VGAPNLGPLQDNGGPTLTMEPLPGSPALGTAVAGLCPATDQRGVPRTATCDLGAYQTGVKPAVSSLNPTTTVAVGPAFTLTVTGSGFIPGTVALWNSLPRPTTVLSTTVLAVSIPAADILTSGTAQVQAQYGLATDSTSLGSLPFIVTKAAQTIAFGTLPDVPLTTPPFPVTATASSGLPVSFSASGACTSSGATVTLTGVGSCSMTASQAGDASYQAATPETRAFAVTKASQTISFGALPNVTVTSPPFPVTATASSGLPVSFSASGSCALSGSTLTVTGVGSCTVTASQPGNDTFAAAPSVQQSFTVTNGQVFVPSSPVNDATGW